MRLSSDYSEIKIRLKFDPASPAPNYAADWNKPPTEPMLVAISTEDGKRVPRTMRWGLLLIYLSGVASLLGGIAILNAHRTWTADWRVIITILGWIFVIAGFIRIVLRRQMTTIYSGSIAMTIVGVVVLVLGGYLSFEGYRPVSN